MDDLAADPCPDCGHAWAADALACPSCRRLRHRDELTALSREATRLEAAGEPSAALAAWRSALDRLPADTRQHAQVRSRIVALSRAVDGIAPAPAADARPPVADTATTRTARRGGWLAATGMLLWKIKAIVVFVALKGKLLLLGLTKLSTLLSMALSFALYWSLFGWKFGAGFILSIYIHEMGHVAALRRFGIAASAPMFIPGFGAMVRLNQYPIEPREDARVGLAGPWSGLAAALCALALARAFGSPVALAVARTGAWINLFNLVPVWQLDGSRGFRALSRQQRTIAAAVVAACWLATRENMLVLLLLAAGYRAFEKTAPVGGDTRTLVEYAALVAALSAVAGWLAV